MRSISAMVYLGIVATVILSASCCSKQGDQPSALGISADKSGRPGEIVGRMQLFAQVEKPVVTPNQPLVLTVRYKNVSQKPVYIEEYLDPDGVFGVKVTDTTGQVPLSLYGKMAVNATAGTPTAWSLGSGQAKLYQITINRLCDLTVNGTYSATVQRRVFNEAGDPIGIVVSNVVQVKIDDTLPDSIPVVQSIQVPANTNNSSPSGQTVDGLQLTALAEKKELKPTDPVMVQVSLRNVGKADLMLAENANLESDFSVTVKNLYYGHVYDVPLTRYGQSNRAAAETNALTLKSGETRQYRVMVNRLCDMTDSNTYEVTVKRRLFDKAKNAYVEVVSNPVTLKVAAGSAVQRIEAPTKPVPTATPPTAKATKPK